MMSIQFKFSFRGTDSEYDAQIFIVKTGECISVRHPLLLNVLSYILSWYDVVLLHQNQIETPLRL